MLDKLRDAVIASVRLRASQGDCPTEPAHSVETLESVILDLAPAVDADEFATVEEWEHDDQRELSRLYNHKAHDGPQFNRGQMREAIRHGKRLASPAVDAVPAGEVDISTGGDYANQR